MSTMGGEDDRADAPAVAGFWAADAVAVATPVAVGGAAGRVASDRLGISGELVITHRAIGFLGLLESFSNRLLAVPVALFQFEQRPEGIGLHDRVAFEGEVADAVAIAFNHRDAQLDPPRIAIGRVAEVLQLGRADLREDEAFLAILFDDPLGVFFEQVFLVGAAAGNPGPGPAFLVLLHRALQRAVAERACCP